MSNFYTRYLKATKQSEEEKKQGKTTGYVSQISSTSAPKLDPVAMAPTKTTGAGPRRVQIFAESFSPTDTSSLVTFEKPEVAKVFLRSAISGHYLFEELGAEDLEKIISCMRPSFADPNECIIKQGDLGNIFFCLEVGSAEATLQSSMGNKIVATYAPGSCFGELALIYNSPRAASVVASEACTLWTLDLKSFRYILATTSSSKMVTRCEFLKNCKFLDQLSNEQVGKVAGALETYVYEDEEVIIRQGEKGDFFSIIEEGTVRCTQMKSNGKSVDLITLKAGDYFGEMALMLNDTRHANCIAVGKVKCLSLDKDKFNILLGPAQDKLAMRMRVRILQGVPPIHHLYITYTSPIHHLYITYTSPIRHLYITYTSPICHLYITYTSPIRHLYITYTSPIHHLYITYTSPIHHLYITYTGRRRQSLLHHQRRRGTMYCDLGRRR